MLFFEDPSADILAYLANPTVSFDGDTPPLVSEETELEPIEATLFSYEKMHPLTLACAKNASVVVLGAILGRPDLPATTASGALAAAAECGGLAAVTFVLLHGRDRVPLMGGCTTPDAIWTNAYHVPLVVAAADRSGFNDVEHVTAAIFEACLNAVPRTSLEDRARGLTLLAASAVTALHVAVLTNSPDAVVKLLDLMRENGMQPLIGARESEWLIELSRTPCGQCVLSHLVDGDAVHPGVLDGYVDEDEDKDDDEVDYDAEADVVLRSHYSPKWQVFSADDVAEEEDAQKEDAAEGEDAEEDDAEEDDAKEEDATTTKPRDFATFAVPKRKRARLCDDDDA